VGDCAWNRRLQLLRLVPEEQPPIVRPTGVYDSKSSRVPTTRPVCLEFAADHTCHEQIPTADALLELHTGRAGLGKGSSIDVDKIRAHHKSDILMFVDGSVRLYPRGSEGSFAWFAAIAIEDEDG
jgi:hypothetical protein